MKNKYWKNCLICNARFETINPNRDFCNKHLKDAKKSSHKPIEK